jgi:hypothetical protein
VCRRSWNVTRLSPARSHASTTIFVRGWSVIGFRCDVCRIVPSASDSCSDTYRAMSSVSEHGTLSDRSLVAVLGRPIPSRCEFRRTWTMHPFTSTSSTRNPPTSSQAHVRAEPDGERVAVVAGGPRQCFHLVGGKDARVTGSQLAVALGEPNPGLFQRRDGDVALVHRSVEGLREQAPHVLAVRVQPVEEPPDIAGGDLPDLGVRDPSSWSTRVSEFR